MTMTDPPTTIKATGNRYHETGMEFPGTSGLKNNNDLCRLPVKPVTALRTKSAQRDDIPISLLAMPGF
jgi:hypothetical protein